MWKKYRGAENKENRKEVWPWECRFKKGGEVSQYTRKAYVQKKKGHPRIVRNVEKTEPKP